MNQSNPNAITTPAPSSTQKRHDRSPLTLTPYFCDERSLKSLRFHAAQWLGTPFHRNAGLVGVGVDCVQLAGLILRATGALPEFVIPHGYSMDGAHHERESAIIAWLNGNRHFARVPEAPQFAGGGCEGCGGAVGTAPALHAVLPGDVLVFTVTARGGGVEWHCGLLIQDRQFIHALAGRTVQMSSLDDTTYNKRLKAIFRPIVMT